MAFSLFAVLDLRDLEPEFTQQAVHDERDGDPEERHPHRGRGGIDHAVVVVEIREHQVTARESRGVHVVVECCRWLLRRQYRQRYEQEPGYGRHESPHRYLLTKSCLGRRANTTHHWDNLSQCTRNIDA